jgi:hypothetical protein
MYFSLKYLSLSDAVVLKFLAPILTGFSGAIFLKESLSLKDVLAGCKRPRDQNTFFCFDFAYLWCSPSVQLQRSYLDRQASGSFR